MVGPQSLLQMASQKDSERARDLNLEQVMEKEMMESVGRRRRIEKIWSWVIWVMGDPLVEEEEEEEAGVVAAAEALLLVVVSAMGAWIVPLGLLALVLGVELLSVCPSLCFFCFVAFSHFFVFICLFIYFSTKS